MTDIDTIKTPLPPRTEYPLSELYESLRPSVRVHPKADATLPPIITTGGRTHLEWMLTHWPGLELHDLDENRSCEPCDDMPPRSVRVRYSGDIDEQEVLDAVADHVNIFTASHLLFQRIDLTEIENTDITARVTRPAGRDVLMATTVIDKLVMKLSYQLTAEDIEAASEAAKALGEQIESDKASGAHDALKFINGHRARRGQQPLDPARTPYGAWSDADIVCEAKCLGWAP